MKKIITLIILPLLCWTLTTSANGFEYPTIMSGVLPAYPQSILSGAESSSGTVSVTLQTKDNIEKVRAYYLDYLKNHQWQLISSMNSPDGVLMLFTKSDKSLSVYVIVEDGETTILASYE